MAGLRRTLATSDHVLVRFLRATRRGGQRFSLPLPRILIIPMRMVYVGVRACWHTAMRICVAQPIFESYCANVGRRFRTGVFVHWVNGRGTIIVGDDVLIDGKCSFSFAARFTDAPTLRIGDRTGINHACSFVVGREISIGADCRISGGVSMRDSPGHPTNPDARREGQPPDPDAVKPIVIEDNVWIGEHAIVHPGVRIGRDSVIASGAVVTTDVPPGTLVAGNPGRRVGTVYRQQPDSAPQS